MSTAVSEDTRRDAVRDVPLIKEDIRGVHDCCSGQWYISSQLGMSESNGGYGPATLCCSGKMSRNIHCNKVEWSGCLEMLQFTPIAVLRNISCTACVCAYNAIEVCDYAGPVIVVT